MKKNKHIILGVTGSIAAYKSADIIRRLKEEELSVSVVMTKDAESFITSLTLSGLSGEKVISSEWERQDQAWEMPHIRLAESADCFLVAPATANVIGKIACGIADDLLTCLALGIRVPFLIAPAMNTHMYQSLAVKENCEILKKRGVVFIEPVKGSLACGMYGVGHLAEVESIVSAVLRCVKPKAR